MLYHYLAADSAGKIQEAEYDAESLAQVLQYLAGRDLRPIAVKPLKEKVRGANALFGGITIGDKVFLAKYLSLMLKVGTDLLAAINILIADIEKPAMKNLLLEVRENLTKGRPFFEAFERHPKDFSSVFINLVKAAESAGNLQETFADLSKSLQAEAELRGRIKSAIVYPLILLGTSMMVFTFLVTFALPRINKVFTDSGITPPLFSRIVFGVGLFVNDHIVVIAILVLTLLGPGLIFFIKNPIGRRIADRALSRLPLIRNIYRDLAVQRFAATYSALMKAGLPILQTTKIASEVVGSEEFRLSLLRIADEGLAKGVSMGDAFRRELVFPRVVSNLVAISEKAGHLEEVLQTLSEFYSTKVEGSIRTLVSFLEPALLMTMGLLVATIALSIIIPIYQLTTQF